MIKKLTLEGFQSNHKTVLDLDHGELDGTNQTSSVNPNCGSGLWGRSRRGVPDVLRRRHGAS